MQGERAGARLAQPAAWCRSRDDTDVIGWISITRKEAGAFAEKDVELLQTFADQAVIAIQNVELFEEVQARTRDLQESLQQQTATAEVLKVISSSMGDVQPVFEKMLESAAKRLRCPVRGHGSVCGRGISPRCGVQRTAGV